MTQEERDLLLKDLCARLPYNTIVKTNTDTINVSFTWFELKKLVEGDKFMCKPYLRPMSSMTEEEKKDFLYLIDGDEDDFEDLTVYKTYDFCFSVETYDFLNAHHFDYRGLIEKGLALEVPDGMYKEE